MAIRKRKWSSGTGDHEAWVVDYFDLDRKRRHRTFKRKREAEDWASQTRVDIREGVHVPYSTSVTVQEAGDLWLRDVKGRLERATYEFYSTHLRLHIAPFLGRQKLSGLSVAHVRGLDDRLHELGSQPAMRRAVIGSLGRIARGRAGTASGQSQCRA